MRYDFVIIGAGSAGLAAAYKVAGKTQKLNILVLEKEAMAGRKLSAAGNGKCNLTNHHFNASCYHSEDTDLMNEWIGIHSYEEIPSFFDELGIMLYENNGYYYPVSNQGKQVTNLLYEKSKSLGVNFSFETRVTKVEYLNTGNDRIYKIEAIKNNETLVFETRYLMLALGGKASPKLGGSTDGYLFADMLKLKKKPIYPVLSPLYVEDKALSVAKGVRINAVVTLKGDNDITIKEAGQVQFNENSLSGIVIMNLSSYFNVWKKQNCGECLHLDVLPNIDWNSLKEFLEKQKKQFPKETVRMLLNGILPDNFVRYILKRVRLEEDLILKDLTGKGINRLTSMLKKLTFTPVYQEDFDKAQATGGGIALSEVNIKTFECKRIKNLYIVGELLDVYGKCGGYNITFAMLSGIAAASDIVRKCQND